MTFLALFISTPDGSMLKRYIYHEKQMLPDSLISSGLVEKTINLTKELKLTYTDITISHREDNFIYFGMKFGDINVIAISDLEDKLRELVHETGWKFLRVLGEIDTLKADAEIDIPEFNDILDDIIKSYYGDRLSSVAKPSRYLTPAAVFQLPADLQNIAISMISLEQATVSQVATDTGFETEKVERGLIKLVEMGYLTQNSDLEEIQFQL